MCVCVGVGTSCVWEAGREEEEEAEEAEEAGFRIKNKNPTQRCGENTFSQIGKPLSSAVSTFSRDEFSTL